MTYAVGLTGGIGSGKSTVAELFAARGVTIIDADAVSHRVSAPGGPAIAPIRAVFGDEFITADGALDRPRMRAHVFADPSERRRLEAILHPMIRAICDAERASARSPYVLDVVPLLLESGRKPDRVQRVLVVACDETVQIARVMKRSGLAEAEVRAIIATQMPQPEKLRLADDVIDNSGAPDALDEPVAHLHARYLEHAAAFARR